MEWFLDVLSGIRLAWTSPEFDRLRWIFVGVIIAGPLGYLACLDGKEAAREDDARTWLADAAAGEEEHHAG